MGDFRRVDQNVHVFVIIMEKIKICEGGEKVFRYQGENIYHKKNIAMSHRDTVASRRRKPLKKTVR